jgi:hypothetical protein
MKHTKKSDNIFRIGAVKSDLNSNPLLSSKGLNSQPGFLLVIRKDSPQFAAMESDFIHSSPRFGSVFNASNITQLAFAQPNRHPDGGYSREPMNMATYSSAYLYHKSRFGKIILMPPMKFR